jgi:hypothetical protein
MAPEPAFQGADRDLRLFGENTRRESRLLQSAFFRGCHLLPRSDQRSHRSAVAPVAVAVPSNITLLELPPYSPELNPVERIWHYLRSHWLANSVFPSLADIMDACETACNRFAADHALIRSLCAVAWAADSPAQ